MSTYEAVGAERRPRSVSPGPPCYSSSEGRSSPTLQERNDPQATESRPTPTPTPTPPAFPVSHLLDFGTESRAERRKLSARLSSEVGVPESTALSALETFGVDITRARQWLQTSQHAQQVGSWASRTCCPNAIFLRVFACLFTLFLSISCKQVPKDELKVLTNASTPPQVADEVGTDESNGASQIATENSIVSGLVGTDDTEPARGSGEPASVPSAEEGLNLWESEGKIREATAPTDISTTQVMGDGGSAAGIIYSWPCDVAYLEDS